MSVVDFLIEIKDAVEDLEKEREEQKKLAIKMKSKIRKKR